MILEELLVVGWDLESSTVVHVDDQAPEALRRKGCGGDRTLVCLYCLQGWEATAGTVVPLVVKGKVRGRRRYHFAHPPHMAPQGGHGAETRWHVDGKLAVSSWARRLPNVAGAVAEWFTGDKVRRADVMIRLVDGTRIAVELQYRPLTDGAFARRHQDYVDRGISPVWLWRPFLDRPGIMLERRLPVWWFDVAEQRLTGLFGQGHVREDRWHYEEVLEPYAVHWPPCPDDRLERITWAFRHTRVGPNGFTPSKPTLALMTEEVEQLRSEAEGLREEDLVGSQAPDNDPGPPQDGSDAGRLEVIGIGIPVLRVKDTKHGYRLELNPAYPHDLSSPRAQMRPEPPRIPRPGDDLLPRHPSHRKKPRDPWICPDCGTRGQNRICRGCDYPQRKK